MFFFTIYCISKTKKLEVYNNLFYILKKLINLNFPKFIIWDFEKSLLYSIKISFNKTRLSGCKFHFCQSILRKLKSLGLFGHYKRSILIKKFVKGLMALSYVDCDKVKETFFALKNSPDFLVILIYVYYYFFNYYIGNENKEVFFL